MIACTSEGTAAVGVAVAVGAGEATGVGEAGAAVGVEAGPPPPLQARASSVTSGTIRAAYRMTVPLLLRGRLHHDVEQRGGGVGGLFTGHNHTSGPPQGR